MKENGVINETQAANSANKQSVTIIGEHPHASLVTAPYFQDAVRQALKQSYNLTKEHWHLVG